MKTEDIANKLAYPVIHLDDSNPLIENGYTSDLLSDVMGNAQESSVLITIQGHKNCVAVASLVGIPAIILCNGRKAPEDMVEAAKNEGISIFSTGDNQFTASWKIAGLLELR
jgi:hypothetical protein